MTEVLFVGSAQAIFVSLFLWSKEYKTVSDKLLSCWMLFLAMPMISRIMSPGILDLAIPILSESFPYPLTFGPFLWLYTQSLVGSVKALKPLDLMHFVPFAVCVVYRLLSDQVVSFPHSGPPGNQSLYMMLVGWGIAVSLIAYAVAVILRLRFHHKEIFNHFSYLSKSIRLRWLSWMTLGFVLASSLPLIDSVFPLPPYLRAHGIAFTGFIFVLSFYGLKQLQIYNYPLYSNQVEKEEVDPLIVAEQNAHRQTSSQENAADKGKNKYQRSGLDQERALIYLHKLEDYMQQERPYLDAGLTIEKLAKTLGIQRHYLTQVISEQLDKNFYIYVNEYRIKAIKTLLSDPENQHMTLIDIALTSGFNSKSTFNKVFKTITNMTPSQYKKSLVQA